MSVGVGVHLKDIERSDLTFFVKIGAEPGQSGSLYKTCWSSGGVNFLTLSYVSTMTGSSCTFAIRDVYEDG